jgi:outer membrane protein OmpA-like peptidoglycan-associated protein
MVKDDPYVEFLLRSLQWAVKYQDSVRNFTILPTNLDVSGQSVGYAFFDDGLIYAHSRSADPVNPSPAMDLDFAVIRDSVTFTDGDDIMADIRFDLNEGSPSISSDGSLMYFCVNATKVRKSETRKVGTTEISSDGVANFKIYVATFVNGVFTNPQELPFNNKEYNCVHPCITPDGNTLYFASDMPGGAGGLDLYIVTRKQDGNWGKPRNLGNKVNTLENELYPFLTDGYLYFCSKGFNGYGGYDIYESKLVYGMPAPPNNMGKPFNSPHDDVAFICRPSRRTGYFSSNRGSGEGMDKVYYFRDNAIEKRVLVPATAAVTKPPAVKGGGIAQQNPSTAKPPVKPATPQPEKVALVPPDPPKIVPPTPPIPPPVVPLEPKLTTEDLTNIEFETVEFGFNEVAVRKEQYEGLDSVAHAVKFSKVLNIQVSAHTDCIGSEAFNQVLSEKRAAAAKAYLLKKGVPASRIITIGYGESQPLELCNDCSACTLEQNARNRRVEVKLVKR